jgi:uncharacterized protein YndB with AHSA1/START domain
MTSAAPTATTTQVYRVWIKATPEAIWDAITKTEWTARYGYGGTADYDLQPGRLFVVHPTEPMASMEGVPEDIIDGEVVEADPPRRLALTWRMLMDPGMQAEGFTKLTYEIEPVDGGATRLTVIHELEGAPALAAMVGGQHEAEGAGGGWAWVLSDLKSLLETGAPLAG